MVHERAKQQQQQQLFAQARTLGIRVFSLAGAILCEIELLESTRPISKDSSMPYHTSTIQLSGPVSVFSSSPLMPIGKSVAGSRQQNNRPDLPPNHLESQSIEAFGLVSSGHHHPNKCLTCSHLRLQVVHERAKQQQQQQLFAQARTLGIRV